jgi:hypothetical protein
MVDLPNDPFSQDTPIPDPAVFQKYIADDAGDTDKSQDDEPDDDNDAEPTAEAVTDMPPKGLPVFMPGDNRKFWLEPSKYPKVFLYASPENDTEKIKRSTVDIKQILKSNLKLKDGTPVTEDIVFFGNRRLPSPASYPGSRGGLEDNTKRNVQPQAPQPPKLGLGGFLTGLAWLLNNKGNNGAPAVVEQTATRGETPSQCAEAEESAEMERKQNVGGYPPCPLSREKFNKLTGEMLREWDARHAAFQDAWSSLQQNKQAIGQYYNNLRDNPRVKTAMDDFAAANDERAREQVYADLRKAMADKYSAESAELRETTHALETEIASFRKNAKRGLECSRQFPLIKLNMPSTLEKDVSQFLGEMQGKPELALVRDANSGESLQDQIIAIGKEFMDIFRQLMEKLKSIMMGAPLGHSEELEQDTFSPSM